MNVCTHLPERISHSLAVASQAPDTKMFWLGESDKLRHPWREKSGYWLRIPFIPLGYSPHNISSMVVKLLHSRPSFDIPKHTRHITRGRHDLTIVDKSTTTQVTRMSAELPGYLRNLTQRLTGSSAAATSFERVDGTYIVQTSAGNELTGR